MTHNMLTYPARPINGGPPHLRRPLHGQWIAQPKFNGWRALVHLPADGTRNPVVWNRHGEPLSIRDAFAAPLHDAQMRFPLDTWLDCEALERRGTVTGTLVILDWIIPALNWTGRKARLLEAAAAILLPWDAPPTANRLLLTDEIPGDPTRACASFAAANTTAGETLFEGFVCKRTDSFYPIQTRSSTQTFSFWVKHRFA
jgi:hypothetical protein